ncbi:MAG: hypothetical protein IPP19_05560 [Verrucomicrobia bacterium]|nr:hypothetical protein [Verrucomicrobiota bacterium]
MWVRPWWAGRNAVSMARQWIAAGKANYAAEVVQKALEKDPEQPELWMLAAELARLNGPRILEVEYAHRAALLRPGNPKYALEWAGAALRADQRDVMFQALKSISDAELDRSSVAQRLLGELKRREHNFAGAVVHFEAALRLDGPGATNEIPLGLCLLAARGSEERERGHGLLEKWSADSAWGATALRLLLLDAGDRGDRPAALKWALALSAHPGKADSDAPDWLRVLAKEDRMKFEEELGRLKMTHKATPEASAQLLGWLNEIGESRVGLDWLGSLPEQDVQRPPLSLAKAEALRIISDWSGLQALTIKGEWGANLDFLRWTYGLRAARALADEKQAENLWLTLVNHSQVNAQHALFGGSMLYSWGMVNEAEALWWRAAEQGEGVSFEALGALARFYQVRRDADGQHRVFRKLHAMRPDDDAITNNYVFFAVLTGNRERESELLARDIMLRNAGNQTYLATYAYVLFARDRSAEALKLVAPAFAKDSASPTIQFAYGLALAGSGEQEKARPILRGLDPATLTTREEEIIEAVLNGGGQR